MKSAPCFFAIAGIGLMLQAIVTLHGEAVPDPQAQRTPLEFLITPRGDRITSLVSEDGTLIREWGSAGSSVSARRCEDGGLLRVNALLPGASFRKKGPVGGSVERFNVDGVSTWMFRYSNDTAMIYGDALCLPNGNILSLFVERHTKEEAIARGRSPDKITEAGLWSDGVIEIKPVGKSGGRVVWKWMAWNHLVQNTDEKLPNYGKPDEHKGQIDINGPQESGPVWSRITGLDYDAATDRVLMVAAGFGQCWVIDRAEARKDASCPILFKSGSDVKDGRWARVAGEQEAWIASVESRARGSGGFQARLVHVNPTESGAVKSGPWMPVGSTFIKLRPVSAGKIVLWEPNARSASLVTGLGASQHHAPLPIQFSRNVPKKGAGEDHLLTDASWSLDVSNSSN